MRHANRFVSPLPLLERPWFVVLVLVGAALVLGSAVYSWVRTPVAALTPSPKASPQLHLLLDDPTPSPAVPVAADIQVLRVRVVPYVASGMRGKQVLVDWKNLSDAPIRTVRADLELLDDAGNQVEYGGQNQTIFAPPSAGAAVAPGGTYHEQLRDGFFLLPGSRATRARVTITYAK